MRYNMKCQKCGCIVYNKNQKYCEACNIIIKKEQSKNRREENTKRNKERDYSLDVGGKKCPCCGEYKEYKEFNKSYKEIDGYKSKCRKCQNTLTPEQQIRRKEYNQSPKRKEKNKARWEKEKQEPDYKEKRTAKQEKQKEKIERKEKKTLNQRNKNHILH